MSDLCLYLLHGLCLSRLYQVDQDTLLDLPGQPDQPVARDAQVVPLRPHPPEHRGDASPTETSAQTRCGGESSAISQKYPEGGGTGDNIRQVGVKNFKLKHNVVWPGGRGSTPDILKRKNIS